MSRASVVLKFFFKTLILLENDAQIWEVLDQWRSDLWVVEFNTCCRNVYGKKAAALLNILSSV